MVFSQAFMSFGLQHKLRVKVFFSEGWKTEVEGNKANEYESECETLVFVGVCVLNVISTVFWNMEMSCRR